MKKKILFILFLLSLLVSCMPTAKEPTKENETYHKVDFYYDKQVQLSYQVKENQLISIPQTPTKEGFVFDGWYVDYEYKQQFDFSTEINQSLTLYGRFLEIFTVTFDEYETSSVVIGNTVEKPKDPVKEDYVFIGWYYNDELFDFNTKIDKDITLIAKFKQDENKTFTVTFTDTDIVEKVKLNQTVTKPNDPTKEGYRFEGWYINLEDEIKFDFKTKITQDIILYPNFIKIYKIILEDIHNQHEDITVDENTNITFLPTPTKTGYEFMGWYLNSILFDSSSIITSDITLVAKWNKINLDDSKINILSYGGYNEGAYVEFNKVEGYLSKNNYSIYYKKQTETNYIKLDSNLIQENEDVIRADILGITEGYYDIKITLENIETTIPNILVSKHDRSGYAHFNTTSSVGGYNLDGTPKDNAVIIYVTENTKNSVTASFSGKTYTGIAEILKNASKCSNPLIIRILGTITAATWKPISYSSNVTVVDKNGNKITSSLDEADIISKGVNELNITDNITKLNGLTNKISYSGGEYDSNFNMLYVQNAKNITVEGVGPNAKIFQWGFCFKNCSYIEVRNLTFDDYTEDACSFEGSDTSAASFKDFEYGHIWVHNNTFNEGINYWDVTAEQDKHEGDGATDFKGLIYITLSYNHYYKNHKTGLIGGSNSQTTACVTFHHNFYEECSSRLPLGRQANMHMYNNYYYKISGTTMSIRAGGYAFIENCVFESCNNPMSVADDATYGTGTIKSYNNEVISCKGNNHSTTVSSRTEQVTNKNRFDQNFDTNPNNFYYDQTTKQTNVTNLLPTSAVKTYVKEQAGVLKGDFIDKEITPETPTLPDIDITNSNLICLNDFSLGDITSSKTVNEITVTPKDGKTCSINECDLTIVNQTITKYVSFGGGASFNTLSIQFTTTALANITVYYSSGGSSERFVKLMTLDSSITASTPTVPSNANKIVSHTFTSVLPGNLAIGSSNSGINIYCIVIEYI